MHKPYNIFIVCARKDVEYLEELRGHLRPLERAEKLKVWCDKVIDIDIKCEKVILHKMDTADIILLMVSAAYYDDSYLNEKELKYAMDRHEKGEAMVIPVIVRKCRYDADPLVSNLQVLPKDAKAVITWSDRDDAWLDVVDGIEKAIKNLKFQQENQSDALKKQHKEKDFDYPLVKVEGGNFMIYCHNNQKDTLSNEFQHLVTVSDFLIGKYPVTQNLWKSVMGENPSYFKYCGNCPVENVNWNDVQLFIQKLNEKTGDTWRLPTETEWEYAARGGQHSKEYMYSGGNDLNKVGWYEKNSNGKTQIVGGKASNELGLYDMSGNVYEWCEDLYKSCPYCGRWNQTNFSRVFRGGSYLVGSTFCCVAARYSHSPDYRSNHLGFRLVRAL
jgi:formylglycine-generating enzyme required for sulfatase activity